MVSIECGYCERDLRGPHNKDCPKRIMGEQREEIERLQARVEQLEGALLEIVKETDGIDCDGCYVRNEIARKALGAGTEYPEALEQQEQDGE